MAQHGIKIYQLVSITVTQTVISDNYVFKDGIRVLVHGIADSTKLCFDV